MNRSISFDLDGTLIDSREDITNALNRTLKEYGLPGYPVKTVMTFVGDGAEHLVIRALNGAEVPVDEFCRKFRRTYAEHAVEKTVLYPGVSDTLKQLLERGWILSVFSNKPQELCEPILQTLGVAGFFRFICGGGGKFPLKPAPDALLYILKTAKADPAQSWMVGDHWTDLAAGKNTGIKTAFAQNGIGERRRETPDAIFRHFQELTTIVESGRQLI